MSLETKGGTTAGTEMLPVVNSKLSRVILGVVFDLGEYVRKTRKVLLFARTTKSANVESTSNNITCYIDKVSSPLRII